MNSVQAPDNDLGKTPKDELIDINQAIFLRLCIHEEEIRIFDDLLTTVDREVIRRGRVREDSGYR